MTIVEIIIEETKEDSKWRDIVDYKIKDISLAQFGRKEIQIA